MSTEEYTQKLTRYIQSLDPAIFGRDSVKNFSLKQLTLGLHNANLLISFKDGHEKFVVRFHPNNRPGEDKTFTEAANMKLLKNVPAAAVLYLGKADSLNSSVIIMKFVEGVHKGFNELTVSETKVFARTVARIHKIKSDTFSAAPGRPPTAQGNYGGYLKTMFDSSVVQPLSLINPALYKNSATAITKAGEQLDTTLMSAENAFDGTTFGLMHTDIGEGNVLWADGKITIIDWEEITFGDPADEVSYIFAINNLDKHHQSLFLKEYLRERVDETLEVRLPAYTIKNRLFDLVWSLSKLQNQQLGKESKLLQKPSNQYQKFYDERREALAKLVETF